MKKSYLILAMLFAGYRASAQNPKVTPVSPEASALAKMVNYPVNLNTGIPDISIPLYKIESGGLTLPITLNYHSGGFKINERSTNVGLGWSLSCDLQITRAINGLDDILGTSTGGVGYIANTKMKIGPSPNYASDPSIAYPLNDGSRSAYDLAAGLVDGMPDKFNYRLLNKSGSFYFQKDQSGSGYTIVPVPFDNLKISYDSTNGGFIIIDTDGTSYTFGGSAAREYSTAADNNVTAWKCTQIANPTNTEVISFTYQSKSALRNVIAQDRIEYINNENPCSLRGNGFDTQYIRAGQVSPSIATYEALTTQYPSYRLSSPRYTEYFGYRPVQALFHLPDLDAQNQVLDRTFTVNQGNIASTSTAAGLALSAISFRGGNVTFSGADQLYSISINDGNSEIRSFSFFQSNALPVSINGARTVNGDSFTGTYYLDSIQVKSNGAIFERYNLQYKDKYCFGNHLSGKDAWGYPNDYTIDNSAAADPANFCNSCDHTIWLPGAATTVPNQQIVQRFQKDIYGGCTNSVDNVTFKIGNITNTEKPSLSGAQHGILKRIVYPTGGFVDFDFESNKYKQLTTPAQVVRMGGGLRVRSINYYDGKSDLPVSQKYYTYGDYEDGIGLLLNLPSRNFIDSKFEYDPYSYSQTISYLSGPGSANLGQDFAPVPIDCTSIDCMTLRFSEKKTTYLPASSLDNTYSTGAPIYYTKVTEYNSDLGIKTGKKVSVFYKPNAFSPYTYGPQSKVIGTNIDVLQTDGLMGELKYIKEYKYENGKYLPLHSKEYTFTKYSRDQIRVAYSYFNVIYQVLGGNYQGTPIDFYHSGYTNYYSNSEFITGQYGIQVGRLLLSTETEKWYRNSDSTSVLTQYSYDANGHMQPSGIVTTNSKGEQLSKSIKYAYDFVDPVYVQMTTNNMISQPIEEVLSNITLTKEISRTKTNYGSIAIPSGPTFIGPLSAEKSVAGNTSYTVLTYDKYDQYANILQITGIDKQPISYLWGYNSKYPIAEVKGTAYTNVVNAVNATGVSISTLLSTTDETQLRNTINTLRTNLSYTLINSFTHKPLIGLSSQTNPAGFISYYEYDPFGRLKIIRDQSNNIIKKYDYKMLNSSSSFANTVLYANYPMMETYYGTLYDGTAASLNTNKLYNLISPGGKYTTYDAFGANNLARGGSVLDSLSVSVSPVNLANISMTNWSPSDLPDPGYVHLDLIQNGSVVFSKTFPRDSNNNATHTITFTVPAGQYQVSLRQESNFPGAVLTYRFDNGSGTPTVFLNTADTINLVSGQSYNLMLYNNYPH